MKKIFTSLFTLLISASLFAGGPEGDYKIDKSLSSLDWVGKKVTGQHTGTVNIKDGSVEVKEGMLVGGTLMIDMTSIVVTDIEDPGTNAKLLGHLKSPDFFNVAESPMATLKITKVEKKEGDKYHLHGDLTIKGITKKVEIPATILMKDDKIVVVGETEIDRTQFDIKYGSGKFFDNLGDRMIDDMFEVKFKVAARRS